MKERLEIIQERYNNLNEELLKPEVYNDYKKMQTISKEKNSIEPIVEAYKKYNTVLDDIEAAKEMSKDPEMKEFALEEIDNLHKKKESLESKLKIMLLPKDPNDEKMLSLRFVVLLEEMKLISLLEIYLECILSMLKSKDGNLK